MTGTSDMFWNQPMDMNFINSHCANKFDGTVPRPDWIAQLFGGIAGVSNIVFSNGCVGDGCSLVHLCLWLYLIGVVSAQSETFVVAIWYRTDSLTHGPLGESQ